MKWEINDWLGERNCRTRTGSLLSRPITEQTAVTILGHSMGRKLLQLTWYCTGGTLQSALDGPWQTELSNSEEKEEKVSYKFNSPLSNYDHYQWFKIDRNSVVNSLSSWCRWSTVWLPDKDPNDLWLLDENYWLQKLSIKIRINQMVNYLRGSGCVWAYSHPSISCIIHSTIHYLRLNNNTSATKN